MPNFIDDIWNKYYWFPCNRAETSRNQEQERPTISANQNAVAHLDLESPNPNGEILHRTRESTDEDGLGSTGGDDQPNKYGLGSTGMDDQPNKDGIGSTREGDQPYEDGLGSTRKDDQPNKEDLGSSGKRDQLNKYGLGSTRENDQPNEDGPGSTRKDDQLNRDGLALSGENEQSIGDGLASSGENEQRSGKKLKILYATKLWYESPNPNGEIRHRTRESTNENGRMNTKEDDQPNEDGLDLSGNNDLPNKDSFDSFEEGQQSNEGNPKKLKATKLILFDSTTTILGYLVPLITMMFGSVNMGECLANVSMPYMIFIIGLLSLLIVGYATFITSSKNFYCLKQNERLVIEASSMLLACVWLCQIVQFFSMEVSFDSSANNYFDPIFYVFTIIMNTLVVLGFYIGFGLLYFDPDFFNRTPQNAPRSPLYAHEWMIFDSSDSD